MIETFIDHPDVLFTKLGDKMGECDGKINSLSWDGALVQVSPEPVVCDFCKFSEWCTESKAD